MGETWKLFNDNNQLKTLHVLVGLPYTGKSTWAKSIGWPMVSPDAIRLSLHETRFNEAAELMVWSIAQYMVQALFIAGHPDVIVDGCHTTKKRRDIWRTNAGAGQYRRWVTHFHTFTTPMAVCLGRAAMKGDQHIVKIIQRMHGQWEDVSCDGEQHTVPKPTHESDYEPETIHEYASKEDTCIVEEKTYKTAGEVVDQEVEKGTENTEAQSQESTKRCAQGTDREPQTQPERCGPRP